MAKINAMSDPRGYSLRIYHDIYNSSAFKALTPHAVMAYLALLAELRKFNNGDLSLTLSRAKNCGVNHHITLARSLRALCAVGLIALTRRGGCGKGGKRLPSLYRMTDRDCYEMPAKHIEAKVASNDWKRVTSVEQGLVLITANEASVKSKTAKLKTLGHRVTDTTSPNVPIKAKTRTPRDTSYTELGHLVTKVENEELPVSTGLTAELFVNQEKTSRGTSHVPPLYIATPVRGKTSNAASVAVTRKAAKFIASLPRGNHDYVAIRAGLGAGLNVEQLIDWADADTVTRALADGPLPFIDLWTVVVDKVIHE